MLDSLAPTHSIGPAPQVPETYPHAHMWINGRYLTTEKIVAGTASPESPFEETTFDFIRSWISGEESFDMTTSGSTGSPKSFSLRRTQMIKSTQLTARQVNLTNNMTALLCIDPRYIGGKMMLVRTLVLGLRLVAVEPSSNPLVGVPVDKRVHFTALVPYQVQSILESKHPHLLNNLDTILIGGAPLHATVRETLQRFQCKCYETYGMTETISHIALRLANTKDKQPYFQVLPGIDISRDKRQCLVINAPYLPEPVVTNDLIEIVAPGRFEWLGRWDNVINSGGVKISPEKVERQLDSIFLQTQFPHRFFVAALPDQKLGNKLILILEGVHFSSETLQQSLEQLKNVLSPYEVPREVYFAEHFSSTESQKIDRKQTMTNILPVSRHQS